MEHPFSARHGVDGLESSRRHNSSVPGSHSSLRSRNWTPLVCLFLSVLFSRPKGRDFLVFLNRQDSLEFKKKYDDRNERLEKRRPN